MAFLRFNATKSQSIVIPCILSFKNAHGIGLKKNVWDHRVGELARLLHYLSQINALSGKVIPLFGHGLNPLLNIAMSW